MRQEVARDLAEVGSKVQYSGSGAGLIIGGLQLSEWAAVAAIVIGALGLLVNTYFKHKQTKLLAQVAKASGDKRRGDIPEGLEKFLGDD
jgi:hypothetical protein